MAPARPLGASPRNRRCSPRVVCGARPGTPSADSDSKATRDLLEACIGELHPREQHLLLAQFGFTHDQRSRERREAAYLEDAQKAGEPGSASSFDRWSKLGLEQVADAILERVATADLAHERQVALGAGPMAREPLLVEGRFDRYRFREGRGLLDLVCDRVVKCLAPGDHVYLAHHVYYADRREGAIEIEPEFGCRMVTESFEDGVKYCVLALNKTLALGETFRFSYRVHVRSDVPFAPVVQHTDDYETDKWVVEIEFAEDALPRAVWMFAHVPRSRAGLKEFRRQVQRPHDGSRYIRESWQGLQLGLTYGLDWDW